MSGSVTRRLDLGAPIGVIVLAGPWALALSSAPRVVPSQPVLRTSRASAK
jgi:hypothetical protein